MKATWTVQVFPQQVRKAYNCLRDAGILDTTYEIDEFEKGIMSIPVTDPSQAESLGYKTKLSHSIPRKPLDPHKRLKAVIEGYLGENEGFLLADIPETWQIVGAMAIFPKDSFSSEWGEIISSPKNEKEGFWKEVAKALYVKKIGIGNYVDSGPMRQSRVKLMLGDDGWVTHKEHGVNYVFDATKVMFSQGNLNERGRMGKLDVKGETIVDLYCGIGYYSLQLLTNGKCKHLHACEMNPDSIEALKRGLEINQVANKCTIHQGNNQNTAPNLSGIADRVLLGLLPTSTASWQLAINCLKAKGGVIHVHENIEEYEEGAVEKWVQSTVDNFVELAKNAGHKWQITSYSLQKIKWYAPSVRHVVLDLKMGPRRD